MGDASFVLLFVNRSYPDVGNGKGGIDFLHRVKNNGQPIWQNETLTRKFLPHKDILSHPFLTGRNPVSPLD